MLCANTLQQVNLPITSDTLRIQWAILNHVHKNPGRHFNFRDLGVHPGIFEPVALEKADGSIDWYHQNPKLAI
jgi:hypothetical protein